MTNDATRPDPLAARLVELRAKATPGPWCAESLGEKGDGSNIIGVAFHPDDKNAEHPLSGWLEPYDVEGNEIDYYRDQDIAEIEHRTQGANQNTDLILALVNNLDAIIAALGSRDGWRDISTAPRDGTPVDLWVVFWNGVVGEPRGERSGNCNFKGDGWHDQWGNRLDWEDGPDDEGIISWRRVTHWMPLPAPPTGGALADPASAEDGR